MFYLLELEIHIVANGRPRWSEAEYAIEKAKQIGRSPRHHQATEREDEI